MCPKKSYLQNAAGAMVHCALAQLPKDSTVWAWKMFFARFLLRLSWIKRSQLMFKGTFGLRALNFG